MLVASILLSSPLDVVVQAIPSCPADTVRVPAGRFVMGSDASERAEAYAASSDATRAARWFDAELPRQEVTLPAFCIDRTLVSQRDYVAFVRATSHRVPGSSKQDYEAQGFLVHDYHREVRPYLWRERRPPRGREDHPMRNRTVAGESPPRVADGVAVGEKPRAVPTAGASPGAPSGIRCARTMPKPAPAVRLP